jgi:hypothetical protein
VSDDLTIKTDGGTTFTVAGKDVTIAHGGHVIVVPLADLREFMGLRDLENGDDDFEGDEP